MKGGFSLFNGKFYRESDPLFTGADLARLNSGICESFRAENNRVIFVRENYNFLIDSLQAIDLSIPAEWNFPRFIKDVSRLLNKNHLYLSAKVVIHFIPGVSGTDYLMMAEEMSGSFFAVSDSGLLIDFYDDGAKGTSIHCNYEPSSRSLWAMAARSVALQSKQNLILLNSKGFACESIGGSFGYLTGQKAFFPSPASLGYIPAMTDMVKNCAEECGYQPHINPEIKRTDLLDADELFLIDNCHGIQSVLGLYARRYYTDGTMAISARVAGRARNDNFFDQHPPQN